MRIATNVEIQPFFLEALKLMVSLFLRMHKGGNRGSTPLRDTNISHRRMTVVFFTGRGPPQRGRKERISERIHKYGFAFEGRKVSIAGGQQFAFQQINRRPLR